MPSIASKIAFPIILAGLFIVIVFVALNYNSLDANFYIVILAVAIYIFLFGFATGQSFSSPIRKLLERALELTKGDLSSRVYLESKDEIGALAKVLNDIAEKLEESKNIIEATEKGVDIKVKVRTEALEETITALEQKVKNRTLELEKTMNELAQLKRQIDGLNSAQKVIKKQKNARAA